MSSGEAQGQQLAERFRRERGLAQFPVADVFELVHDAGVDVFSMTAQESEHGLSAIDTATGRYAIVVATTRHPLRQRSTVLHELGHVLAGDLDHDRPFTPGAKTIVETRATAFARHALLPLGVVRQRAAGWRGDVPRRLVSELVQEFGVSPHMVGIQLKMALLMTSAQCRELAATSARTLAAEFGWLSQYEAHAAASSVPRAPQSLMAAAADGYRQGLLGISEVALWYGLAAEDLITQLGDPIPVEPADDDALDTELFGDAT